MENNQAENNSEKQSLERIDLSDVLDRITRCQPVPAEDFERLEPEDKQELAKRRREIDLLDRSIGDIANGYRFAKYKVTNPKQQKAFAAVKEWAETYMDRAPQSLILFGSVGVGKDHLAFAAVRQVLLQAGGSARWINGRDLFANVRDRMNDDKNERDLLAEFIAPKILIISDPLPPVGELTTYQADVFYRLVDARSRQRRVNVVTVNASDDGEARDGLGVAAWDRLCDDAWKVCCSWKSHRQPARVVNA